MSKHTLLTTLLALSLAASAAFALQHQDDEDTPLQQAMHQLKDGQRKLHKLKRDPVANKDGLLAACEAIQGGALAAFSLPPAAPEGEPAAAWRIGYQRTILQVLDSALELEAATHAGDSEAVAAAYERLAEVKKGGHDRYQQDE
jgi:hypothetical protein